LAVHGQSRIVCDPIYVYDPFNACPRAQKGLHDTAIKFSNASGENRSGKIYLAVTFTLNQALSMRRRANEYRAIFI